MYILSNTRLSLSLKKKGNVFKLLLLRRALNLLMIHACKNHKKVKMKKRNHYNKKKRWKGIGCYTGFHTIIIQI